MEAESAVPPAEAPIPAPAQDELVAHEDVAEAPAPAPVRPLPEDYLHFGGACDPGRIVTVAAIGDLMFHHELQQQAYRAPDRFLDLWSSVIDLLGAADITYGNLESPAAWGIDRKDAEAPDPGLRFDNKVYSGYARFNVHPSIADDLVRTGFDVVSTANNHALDRGSLGVDRTLDALDQAGLRHTGTRRRGTEEPWHTVTAAHGIRIAWLACTLHTNFGRDHHDQVLDCFDKEQRVARLVGELRARPDIDAVIVTPHWGREYEARPDAKQVEYAQRWIDAGALAIVGNHAHVLSPWERREAADGRETFVIYSLGNFVSHQRTLDRRTTILLYLGLRKVADGDVRIVGASYVPLHVRMEGNKEAFFVEAIDRVGGPRDARAHVVELYGTANLQPVDAPIDVAPHCRPAWLPPP